MVHSQIEIRRGLGSKGLKLIAAGEHAEVYEFEFDRVVTNPLVVKTPPLMQLGKTTKHERDAFDEGCFAILGEMDALSRIGNCAYINAAQYAQTAFDVPLLLFRKRDADLRQLITADITAGDQFVRLAVLHMIARGLVAAQQKGVLIHQDLKPENILIDFASQHFQIEGDYPALVIPRINDFELTNRLLGKRLRGFRPYLPAEHYKDTESKIEPENRYDIYSLAVIAHELLTCGFHPMPGNDPRGLHCSAYTGGYANGFDREKKWKAFARQPPSEKTLPAIADRTLASVLSSALDPDFRNRPHAAEMAGAFWQAMIRENVKATERITLAIEFLEESGEIGSGASGRFPDEARKILAESPKDPEAGSE